VTAHDYVNVQHWQCPICKKLYSAIDIERGVELECSCGWREFVTATWNTGFSTNTQDTLDFFGLFDDLKKRKRA
jgi:hypothetical protein